MSMTLESQVTSLDLAKRLKELGVRQESLFWWSEHTDPPTLWNEWDLEEQTGTIGHERYSAFTVAELGEMLPLNCRTRRSIDHKDEWLVDSLSTDHMAHAPTEADARAAMMIYLLETHLLDTTK